MSPVEQSLLGWLVGSGIVSRSFMHMGEGEGVTGPPLRITDTVLIEKASIYWYLS